MLMMLMARNKKPVFRDVVKVKRPYGEEDGEEYGERGEVLNDGVVKYKELPITLMPLQGRLLEQAHELYASATHRVECYGDPRNPIHTSDWLEFCDGRKLFVGYVKDYDNNGIDIELLVGESVE